MKILQESIDVKPSEVEIKKMYELYCQLFTILHDYAVGVELSKTKRLAWAIAANYYSLMHCGRFICLLSGISYPQKHKDLIELFKGKNVKERNREIDFNYIVSELRRFSQCNEIEERLKRLGAILKKIKKLREDSNYEYFIVAHQVEHPFFSSELCDAYEVIKRANEGYISFVLDLYCEYINSLPYGKYVAAFLKDRSPPRRHWGLSYIKRSFKKQEISEETINSIFQLINKHLLKNIQTNIQLDESFFQPIKFREFNEKSEKMLEFKGDVEKLKRL